TPAVPPSDVPELGWGPVKFPFPGGTEPIVYGMTDGAPVFHWHFDTFDLPKLPPPPNAPPPPAPPPPPRNALLSSSKACKNQAFRFHTPLFGFHVHMGGTLPHGFPLQLPAMVPEPPTREALGAGGADRGPADHGPAPAAAAVPRPPLHLR